MAFRPFWQMVFGRSYGSACIPAVPEKQITARVGGVHKTVLKKTDLGICLTGLEQRKSLHEQYLDSV
jgi:hypothetical protein